MSGADNDTLTHFTVPLDQKRRQQNSDNNMVGPTKQLPRLGTQDVRCHLHDSEGR